SPPRADRRAQLQTRGRPRLCRVRAKQPRRKDPRDPPGGPRPHPRRPHPPGRRVLRGETRDAMSTATVPMIALSKGGDRRIRVGIIGANPDRGWAAQAHIPALRSLADNFEITALSTTRRESADAAGELFGVP